MRLNDDVRILPLPMVRDGISHPLHVSLVLDSERGATLIDAGLPGQLDAILAGLADAGLGPRDLHRIVLTHQDFDHVGSLPELVAATGASVLTYETEAPFIDGSQEARFRRPELLEARPELRALAERVRPVPVDERLADGARLDVAGGARLVAAPGHTVGHACVYLERTGTLIAGDALTAADGRLQGPSREATENLEVAMRSVRRLAELDPRAIVCYHGGVVDEDAAGQLRRVAAEPGPA
ncbi:MAG: MBL fold metallo-hydrolase [Candidatus Dormibacteraeota bacterium]|nr:MBL fold metallo-hydrolase [Candidatus Dormibacteraeota bacterium]MBO0760243.1 MBL fold metallo-hydrolase [Candidatus Dormibacteraeota bacterium]